MNRSTQGSSRKKVSILLSKATDGFLKFKLAEGLSNRTIPSYEYYLNQWIAHVGNIDAAKVTASDISHHLAWLRTEYKPRRWNGKTEPLSPKTIRNAYIALSVFPCLRCFLIYQTVYRCSIRAKIIWFTLLVIKTKKSSSELFLRSNSLNLFLHLFWRKHNNLLGF